MPHARLTNPETSHEAAASVKNITQTQQAILSIFERFGAMVDDRLVELYHLKVAGGTAPRASLSGIKTRRKELVLHGLLEDSGDRQVLQSGRKAIVWSKG
jgi:hypothetical protein